MKKLGHEPALLWVFLCISTFLTGCATTAPSTTAAVATAHPLATQAALRTLDQGGNAFDAAITAAAVLGVVEPYSAGLGGGGFWLLQRANGDTVLLDAREVAPLAADEDLYLDEHGELLPGRPSINGPLAAAIPGQPAALAYLSAHYAERPFRADLEAAIRLARAGFTTETHYQDLADYRLEILVADPASREIFLAGGDTAPEPGTLIRQPALAQTLERLAEEGRDGFYDGPVAESLVADVRAAGGIWTQQDLAQYEVILREPLEFEFGDAHILTTPTPSAGGIALAQMFGMLEVAPLPEGDRVARTHHLAEIMRRAYRDRSRYLGDPAFVAIPREQLLDPDYLAKLASTIDPDRASVSANLNQDPGVGRHTTHFSIVDADGNTVSATLSINLPFGSAFTSASTGVVLNNEMDDFSIQPGRPNSYGLVGHRANAIAPGKRPLSSMTPTILQTPSRTTVIGTPGGSRIITMVFLGMLASLDGASADAIVARPRFHHQYLPDEIQVEQGAFTPEEIFQLEALGHTVNNVGRRYGNMQVVTIDHETGKLDAASDPRGIGQAIVRPVR